MTNLFTRLLLVYLIGCVPALAQTVQLVRGPYIQVVTPTSAIVRWRTSQPTVGRLWYGTSPTSLSSEQRETQATQEHVITVSGLQPATRYAYAIGFDDTKLASGNDYYIPTAPTTGSTHPFRIWALGDFGIGSDNQKQVYQALRNATTNRTPDLWVWLGDNAYCCGTDDQYQQYVFDLYGPSLRNIPIFPTPGNHDYADSRTNFDIAYYKLFSFPTQGEAGGVPSGSKSYFSANYGNVHLISLDSQAQEDGIYRLYDTTSRQVQWLKRDLATNKLPWTIVIFHHPPYSKGGHDSDTEDQMAMIRRNLTPILERYGVDLVMNGHSHGYERYYRLKNMTGFADTYKADVNRAETTTGRYDGSANSCPILMKGQGTVYVVNGSGGALGGQSPGFPHPATVYANTYVGGSMLLDVNDNRLDAQLILSDGTSPDRFTIIKNTNKTTSLTAEYADTLALQASWPGVNSPAASTPNAADNIYRWPTGATSRAIRYPANRAGTYTIDVTDDKQCLVDKFTLTVSAQPRLTTRTATTACAGSTIPVTASPENTTKATGWQYDVLLSDASGSFATERVVGSGSINSLQANLPADIAGSGYRLRVRARGINYAELVASDAITIRSAPTATLTGSSTVVQGTPTSLTLTFTGDAPWQGTLSDGTAFSATSSPIALTISPARTTTYSIASLRNGCGTGTVTGQSTVTVLIPTETEAFAGGQLSLFPNPTKDNVQLKLTTTQVNPISVVLRDVQGQTLYQQQFSPANTLTTTIPITAPTGTYLLSVTVGTQTITRKVVKE
ncbi:putative secreted protein (Por secretion system target) [Spirosoma oryzae]|uniref:Putative secreted protein (Por secretion system target) n=1 Tax=Spirosoma oryzae TaxID=1469603 RepID=A0A2T0TBV2_9BACT|nr:metallophosphoesterase [Spirosoma oryzae]PRY43142.1 putative secreted protein (Por secretion system target) [Spirosoma oryzae]